MKLTQKTLLISIFLSLAGISCTKSKKSAPAPTKQPSSENAPNNSNSDGSLNQSGSANAPNSSSDPGGGVSNIKQGGTTIPSFQNAASQSYQELNIDSPYMVRAQLSKGGLENSTGSIFCHVGTFRGFWSNTIPTFREWSKSGDAIIDLHLWNESIFVDYYRNENSQTIGNPGGSSITVCPLSGGLRVRVYPEDIHPLSSKDAFENISQNFSVHVVTAVQTTFAANLSTQAGSTSVKGDGCLIPANSSMSVVFRYVNNVVSMPNGVIPVQIVSPPRGGTGNQCSAGNRVYLKTAHAKRLL